MAQDIINVKTGEVMSGVPSISWPKAGGGQALFSDASVTTAVAADVATGKTFLLADGTPAVGTNSGGGGGETWSWMGRNPTLVQRWTENVALADTDFATWTPATTAKTILAARDAGTFTANLADYNYVVLSKTHVDVAYTGNAAVKASLIQQATVVALEIGRNASNASAKRRTFDTAIAFQTSSRALLDYYSSATVKSSYWATSYYGLYANSIPATSIFSSTTSDTPIVTVKYPALMARCHATYFATSRATQVDQANTIMQTELEVWQVDAHTYDSFALFQISMDMMGDPV